MKRAYDSHLCLREETQSTEKVFQSCLNDVLQTVKALAEKNIQLEKQLIDAEKQNRESEHIHQMEVKSMMDKNNLLEQELSFLKETVFVQSSELEFLHKEFETLSGQCKQCPSCRLHRMAQMKYQSQVNH